MDDITVATAESGEAPGHSLPAVTEIHAHRNEVASANAPRRTKRFYAAVALLIMLVVGLLATVIGLGVAFAGEKEESSQWNADLKEERYNDVFNLLANGVSDEADLKRNGSPQNLASQWLAYEDSSSIPSSIDSTDGYHFVTRYVLTLTHFALGGPSWNIPAGFLSDRHVCSWFYALLNPDNSIRRFTGVGCDDNRKIYALLLQNNNLVGSIPSELGLLTTLEVFVMDQNPQVTGNIPDSFDRLTDLEEFHIAAALLTGTFPSYLGTFSNLKGLDLSYNYLDGTLPASIGQLEDLIFFAADLNNIEGNLGDVFGSGVTGLQKLRALYLESNRFTGELTSSVFSGLPSLVSLDISDNELRGSIPRHLFEMPSLQVLDVHDNEFTSMPSNFENNTVLEFVAMHKNNLQGKIPDSIGQLGKLEHLDLSQNSLTGEIPSGIGQLTDLTYLFLSANNFTRGPVPEFLSSLDKLEELSLKSTHRTGVIPPFIGNDLIELVLLDLDNNELEGEVPENLGSLLNLEWLLLNRNQLNGALPPRLEELGQLRLLYIEDNNITSGLNYACAIVPQGMTGKARIVADCELCDVNEGCCHECCSASTPCTDRSHVPDLDPVWQTGYTRLFYTFSKEDWFSQP